MSSSDVVEQSRQPDSVMFRQGFRLIRRQLGRARREFAVGFAGTSLYAVMTIVSSYVIGWATDSVVIPAVERGEIGTATLVGAALAVIGAAIAKGIGITFRRAGAYAADYRLQARDRLEMTDRMLELPLEWHRRHPTGELLSNVNSDVETASAIAAPLPMALGVMLMLSITTVLLVMTDPWLAVIGFATIPMIALVNLGYQRRMRVLVAESQQMRAEVSEIAHESFDAALVVKTLGREDAEVDRFGHRSDLLRDLMVKVGRLRALFDPLMEALPNLGILAVLFVGARRVDQGLITTGTLVTFAYLFRLVAMPMRVFAWLLADLPRATVGWMRVQRIIDEPARVSYGSSGLSADGGATANADAVGYRYPDSGTETRGVDSICLDVPPGSTVALVGPTGSGKSTIAQLLVRLFDPDEGVIRLDGMAVSDIERAELARAAAIVFQEAFLFDDTVANNITLGEDFSEEEMRSAARIARVDEFVERLPNGFHTHIGERGATLSGGQRQRIALARALIRNPRLLVLDDATSAVDPAIEAEILDGLGRLATSVVIVAHRRSSILLADLVIYVEDGRILGRGTHNDLYRSLPAYARLIDAYDTGDET